MKHIISYSGGKGSAASVLLAMENNLDFDVVFADTLIEDKELYELTDQLEKVIGKPIIKLTDGRTPWDVFLDKRYIGNNFTAHCSQVLKTDMVRKYIDTHYDKNDWLILVLGMGGSETDRLERAQRNWPNLWVKSLLIKYKLHSQTDISNLLLKYGLKIPRLYELGFPHNNCGGFCVRAGLKQFALLLETFPERFAHHENLMEKTMAAIGPTAKPFLSYTKDRERKFITLKQFRELYQSNQLTISPFDFQGCACFVDEV